HPRLARRRQPDVCRSGRGGAFVRRRLFGRSTVGRRRASEELERADQIAPGVSHAAGRDHPRPAAVAGLRRPRLRTSDTPQALKAALAEAARVQGFDAMGVARPDAVPQIAGRLREFLEAGAHGDMDWMASTAERRGNPRTLWPEVRSIVML